MLELNLLRRIDTAEGKPYLGIATGALYSHLGNPGSDFLGLGGAGGDVGT